MIEPGALPSWDSISHTEGLKPLRRGRGQCPLCDSKTAFSCHDEKGFNCFACGEHGDKLTFIMKLHGYDFVSALQYFGIEAGRPPAPDPGILRQREFDREAQDLLHQQCRCMREEFRVRGQVILRAHERLQRDPEDAWAWEWLRWAYTGIDGIEHFLDEHDLIREHRTRRIAA